MRGSSSATTRSRPNAPNGYAIRSSPTSKPNSVALPSNVPATRNVPVVTGPAKRNEAAHVAAEDAALGYQNLLKAERGASRDRVDSGPRTRCLWVQQTKFPKRRA